MPRTFNIELSDELYPFLETVSRLEGRSICEVMDEAFSFYRWGLIEYSKKRCVLSVPLTEDDGEEDICSEFKLFNNDRTPIGIRTQFELYEKRRKDGYSDS